MGRSGWQIFMVIAVLLLLGAAANRFMAENAARAQSAQRELGITVIAPVSTVPTAEAQQVAALPTPAVTSGPINVIMHIVEKGQSLYQIAAQYGVTMEAIAALNNLANPELIYAGQQLMIPVGDVPVAVAFAPTAEPIQEVLPTEPLPIVILPTETAIPVVVTIVTAAPTDTPAPTATLTPPGTLSPASFALPLTLNELPLQSILVLPKEVADHVQEIYLLGREMGRDPRAFSKLGDSIIESPHFLIRFDSGPYNLGPYSYLQKVIDTYKGSFGRDSLAVRQGLHSWSIFDPMWALKPTCLQGENLLACEIRDHNPSILLIQMGTNDVGIPDAFERNIRQAVEYAADNGVVPVLYTKADRHEGGDFNNPIIRRIAEEEQIPLLDFDRIAATLPFRGLDQDGVHLKVFFAHDYTLPEAMERGHAVQNLVTLMMLARLIEVETTGS